MVKNVATTQEVIALLLEDAGIPQKEFSKRIMYSEQAISSWKKGDRGMTYDSFIKVCNACGYDVVIEKVGEDREQEIRREATNTAILLMHEKLAEAAKELRESL